MEPGFWHRKWERNEIGFHQSDVNPLLAACFKFLSLPAGSRVFVPLCGKTMDIAWLLSQGYRVAGAELSSIAVVQLFQDLGVEPAVASGDRFSRYSAEGIDIFAGDIFDLSRDDLGRIDAIYDRAALIALPGAMRNRYAAHLMAVTDSAPQLLICLTYDQLLANGPPFSVDHEEVARQYKGSYGLKRLETVDVAGGVKGCPATESVWLLSKP